MKDLADKKKLPADPTTTVGWPVPRRRIKAKDLAEDIRSDLSDADIMMKYGLSYEALKRVSKKLVAARFLRATELCGRFVSYEDSSCFLPVRRTAREYIEIALPVYEATDTANRGIVRNISEKGIGIAGMSVQLEEAKHLVVLADQFCGIQAIEFQAICRWIRKKTGRNYSSAGLEITEISPESLERIQNLIRFFSCC